MNGMDSEGEEGEEGDGWLDKAEVMSEVHVGSGLDFKSQVSHFLIEKPLAGSQPDSANDKNGVDRGQGEWSSHDDEERDDAVPRLDEHGDLVVPRRKKKRHMDAGLGQADAVVIHHLLKTPLSQVGLQIWRGALLLSDFILNVAQTSDIFNNVTALELGAGTGLAGLVMARFCPLVFITDRGADVLDNCSRNAVQNGSSLCKGESTTRVRELDWERPWPHDLSSDGNPLFPGGSGPYQWTQDDIADFQNVSILLAADVVYSENLTRAFFDILKKLMPANSTRVLYLAMEKRYNFSLTDLDIVANGYKHFRSFITSDDQFEIDTGPVPGGIEHIPEKSDVTAPERFFHGRRIDVKGIKQYVRDYERGSDLELWEIRSSTLDKTEEVE